MVFVVLATHLVVALSGSPLTALVAVLVLGWLLPGVVLTLSWSLPHLDWAEVGGISLGLGLAWGLLVAWGVHLIPGAMTILQLLYAYEAGLAALLLLLLRQPSAHIGLPTPRVVTHLCLLAALAACLRLPGLGYSEFQVDEGVVASRAFELMVGDDQALLRHKKGPLEIVATSVPYAALGTTTEDTARLPFALAAVANVVLVYVLGRRLFSPEVGVAAGLLLAINGYALGLSRVAQYQSFVLLFMTLSFLAAYEFTVTGRSRWLSVAAVSCGAGMLAHYEFALVLPAVLALIVWGWRRSPGSFGVALRAMGVFLLIVLVAYAPLVANQHFEGTQRYVNMRVGAGLSWNGPVFVELGTLYNSVYYLAGLLLLLVVGLVIGWRRARLATCALLLWFVPFLVVYMFGTAYPGAHFYTMMVSWSLIGGYALCEGMGWLRRSWSWWPAAAAGGLWCSLCVVYLYLVFFQQDPEYLQDISANRVTLYWAPYGDNVPSNPRYGFPNRAGWKVIGLLYHWDYLQGTFGSNERGRFLRWYMPGVYRDPQPDYWFVSQTIQYQDWGFDEQKLTSYQRVGEVRVSGRPKIDI